MDKPLEYLYLKCEQMKFKKGFYQHLGNNRTGSVIMVKGFRGPVRKGLIALNSVVTEVLPGLFKASYPDKRVPSCYGSSPIDAVRAISDFCTSEDVSEVPVIQAKFPHVLKGAGVRMPTIIYYWPFKPKPELQKPPQSIAGCTSA